MSRPVEVGDYTVCKVNCNDDSFVYRTDCEYSTDEDIANYCCASACDDFSNGKTYYTDSDKCHLKCSSYAYYWNATNNPGQCSN